MWYTQTLEPFAWVRWSVQRRVTIQLVHGGGGRVGEGNEVCHPFTWRAIWCPQHIVGQFDQKPKGRNMGQQWKVKREGLGVLPPLVKEGREFTEGDEVGSLLASPSPCGSGAGRGCRRGCGGGGDRVWGGGGGGGGEGGAMQLPGQLWAVHFPPWMCLLQRPRVLPAGKVSSSSILYLINTHNTEDVVVVACGVWFCNNFDDQNVLIVVRVIYGTICMRTMILRFLWITRCKSSNLASPYMWWKNHTIQINPDQVWNPSILPPPQFLLQPFWRSSKSLAGSQKSGSNYWNLQKLNWMIKP